MRVYKSLILGKDFADVATPVRIKARALREKAEERERAKAAVERPPMPEEYEERSEWRLLDDEDVVSPLIEAHVEQARRDLPEGWKVQRRTIIETPWVDA